MKKTKIYLDTSVISHLGAPDTPEKMADTLRLWEKIKKGAYEVVLSEVVFDELEDCSEPKRSYLMDLLSKIQYERVEQNSDTEVLANRFIELGILRKKSLDDCLHIASALLSDCDIIVSWNFKHIVNPRIIKGAKIVATMEGHREIMVCSPSMLLEEANDE